MNDYLVTSRLQEEQAIQALSRSRRVIQDNRIAHQQHHQARQVIFINQHLKRSRQRQTAAQAHLVQIQQLESRQKLSGTPSTKESVQVATITSQSMTRSRKAALLAAQRIQLAKDRTGRVQSGTAPNWSHKEQRHAAVTRHSRQLIQGDIIALKLKEEKLEQQARQNGMRMERMRREDDERKYQMARRKLEEQVRLRRAEAVLYESEKRQSRLRANR